MSDRPAKPAQTSWMSPYLTVRDAQAALDFYSNAFGFTKHMAMPGPDGRPAHVEMFHRDILIMFGPEGAHGNPMKTPATSGTPCPIGLYFYVENIDAAFNTAVKAGAGVVQPPTDMFWGDRIATLSDPDDYHWTMATNVGEFDASKMPKR